MRLLTLTMLCLCGAAHARGSVVEAAWVGQLAPKNEAVERARQQVDEGDFEDALRTLQEGLDRQDLTDEQLAEMYRLMGLAHLYMGNEEGARSAFERLLQARPDYELPKATPPKIQGLYGRIKDDIRKRRVLPVTLTFDPVAAAPAGAPLNVPAKIENMALGARAKLFYRRAGIQAFSSVDFKRGEAARHDYAAILPAFELPEEAQSYEVEYYVEVADAAQRRLAGRGDPYNPLTFRVASNKPSLSPVAAPPPLYKSPWLWVGVALLAGAATTGIVLVATDHPTATLPVKIQIEGTP